MVGEGNGGKPFAEQRDSRQAGIEIAVFKEFPDSSQGRGKPAGREAIIGKNHGSARPGYPEDLLKDLLGRYGAQKIIAKNRLNTLVSQGNFQSITLNE